MRFVRQPSLLWDVDLQRLRVGRTCFGTKRPKGPESRNHASKIFCVHPFFFFFVPAFVFFFFWRDLGRGLATVTSGSYLFRHQAAQGPRISEPGLKDFLSPSLFFFFVPALIRFNSYRLRVNKLEPDRLSSLFLFFWRDLRALKAAAKVEAKKLGRRRPDLLDDLSEKMSDAFWVWNASEYDIVAVTAFEAGF